MNRGYIAISFLAIFVCAPAARATLVLPHYDVDSLCAMATLIVKGEIIKATDEKTRDGDCAVWDVTVLATLHGDAQPKSLIRVAGIEEYRKGPGINRVPRTYSRLRNGDVVYLFLVAKNAPPNWYTKYKLTDADWTVVQSGARLVMKDKVLGFGQYTPPPPTAGPVAGFVAMTDKAFPGAPIVSVDEFEKKVKTSLNYVADLRRASAEHSLSEADKSAILRARPAALEREWAGSDYIPRLLDDDPFRPTTQP